MSQRRAKERRRNRARSGRTLSTRTPTEGGRTLQGLKIAAYVVLAGVTLGAAGYFLTPAVLGPEGPSIDPDVIDVAADMGGFDRSTIRVSVGERVTVRLTSLDNRFHTDGGGQHQFAVDELGVNIVAPPLGSATGTFTPTEPGTYVFYCDICCGGRANPTMSGTLVVEA